MEIARRILAIIIMVISVIFVVVCAAVVVLSWSLNTSMTEAITKGLTGVERVLTAADSGLDRVNSGLAEMQINVDTVEENIEEAGETLSETSIVFEIIERTVGDELFPKVNSARETSAAIGESIVAFNETLEALNEIPLVDVPTLTEQLDNASDKIASIQNDVEKTRAELRSIRDEAVSKPVTVITMRTTRISEGLEGAGTAVANTQNNIDENLDTIAGIKERVPGIFDLISLAISFVFLWLGFGQVILVISAWMYFKNV